MAKINVNLGPEDEGKSLIIKMSSKQSLVDKPEIPKKGTFSHWLAIIPLVKPLITRLLNKDG